MKYCYSCSQRHSQSNVLDSQMKVGATGNIVETPSNLPDSGPVGLEHLQSTKCVLLWTRPW